MRICSFLPSSTEIVYALGLGDSLAGVTFECDYPPEARQKPVVVQTKLPHGLSPEEIDRQVNEFAARGESLYQLDLEKLQAIEPELIITQDLCHVCAASPHDLGAVLPSLARPPHVLSLRPQCLEDVWQDIVRVGEATGRELEAVRLVAEIKGRVTRVRTLASRSRSGLRVLCLEWISPPFIAGHWVPEMVAFAGGEDVLGKAGVPSHRTSWEQVVASRPDIVLFMPCGYSAAQTAQEVNAFRFPTGWAELPAVRNGRVYAVDATSYFSRPGPRLAEGLEILLNVLHGMGEVSPPPNSIIAIDCHATLHT
ncbi:MAG: cobalamin-binding protein [Acidobacteriales bacterium]|nr:cobalamin-binding protein [Terriglobales bacterium]